MREDVAGIWLGPAWVCVGDEHVGDRSGREWRLHEWEEDPTPVSALRILHMHACEKLNGNGEVRVGDKGDVGIEGDRDEGEDADDDADEGGRRGRRPTIRPTP